MCFWDEMAFFNCDGTVERQKHLCQRVPYYDYGGGRRAGVEICKSDSETPLFGCRHSETSRTIPHQAIYRHVCDRKPAGPPPATGSGGCRPKWTPVIKEQPFSVFVTGTPRGGGKLKDSVQFRWCDGSLCTVEDVFGENSAGEFNWRGVDLLRLEEGEMRKLVGKGTYEHWVGVWSGSKE